MKVSPIPWSPGAPGAAPGAAALLLGLCPGASHPQRTKGRWPSPCPTLTLRATASSLSLSLGALVPRQELWQAHGWSSSGAGVSGPQCDPEGSSPAPLMASPTEGPGHSRCRSAPSACASSSPVPTLQGVACSVTLKGQNDPTVTAVRGNQGTSHLRGCAISNMGTIFPHSLST